MMDAMDTVMVAIVFAALLLWAVFGVGKTTTKKNRRNKTVLSEPRSLPEDAPEPLFASEKGNFGMTWGDDMFSAKKVNEALTTTTAMKFSRFNRVFRLDRNEREEFSAAALPRIAEKCPYLSSFIAVYTHLNGSDIVEFAIDCPFLEVLDIRGATVDFYHLKQLVLLLPRLKYIDLRETPVGEALAGPHPPREFGALQRTYPHILVNL